MNRVNASWVESEGGNTVELLIAPSKRPFRTSLGQLEPAVSKIVAKTLEDEAVKLRGCSNPSRRCPVTWTAPRRRYSFTSQTNQTSPTVEPLPHLTLQQKNNHHGHSENPSPVSLCRVPRESRFFSLHPSQRWSHPPQCSRSSSLRAHITVTITQTRAVATVHDVQE